MANITKPPILDETGQAIVTALGNVSIRPQIVDNLTTADANKALSANMGNSLKTNIDGLSDVIVTVNNSVNAIKPSLGMNNDTTNSLQNTSDANSVTKTCILYALNASNLPSGVSSKYGYLTTLVASTNLIKQSYTPYNSILTYERIKVDGTWGYWYCLNPVTVRLNNSFTSPTSVSALSNFVVTIPSKAAFTANATLFYENSSVVAAGVGYYNPDQSNQHNIATLIYNSGNTYVHYPTVTWTSVNYNDYEIQICPYGSWSTATSNRVIFNVTYQNAFF